MLLFIIGISFTAAAVCFLYYGKSKLIYFSLFIGTLLIRIYFIDQDNYLHDWDEKYHALVAKNLIESPLIPQLRKDPVLEYRYQDWWDNHIWLHKQPLFLWQMAFSMRVFGVNEIAARLPSAIMCAFIALIIFRLGRITKQEIAGLGGALLFCYSFYSIELTTGAIGMDHNDIAMTFYVTASLWALFEYFASKQLKWLILIGVFAGSAILVKWLVGLLVFGAWGLATLFYEKRANYWPTCKNVLLSLAISCAIFIPWQIFIFLSYPVEANYEYNFNTQHITSSLEGHSGSVFYYLNNLYQHYGYLGWPLLILGFFSTVYLLQDKKTLILLFSPILLVYLFFSIIVETKTAGYVFIVSPLLLFIFAMSFQLINDYLTNRLYKPLVFGITVVAIIFSVAVSIRFETLNSFHSKGVSNYNWENRENKIHNTQIYKSLDSYLKGSYLVFNCKSMESVDAMFYSNQNVYAWWPEKSVYDSLKALNYKIAAFTNHNNQVLPDYIQNDKDVIIIDLKLK